MTHTYLRRHSEFDPQLRQAQLVVVHFTASGTGPSTDAMPASAFPVLLSRDFLNRTHNCVREVLGEFTGMKHKLQETHRVMP